MATHSSTLAWKNPMDGGAWQAAVHGVAKSRARLSDFTFTFMHWRRKWQPTPAFLPGESQGRRSLVGCRLWGRTELDITEGTQQQQSLQYSSLKCLYQAVLSISSQFFVSKFVGLSSRIQGFILLIKVGENVDNYLMPSLLYKNVSLSKAV